MGCEGVLTGTQTYNGVPATLREWGQQDNTVADHVNLQFFNNKMTSKQFIFKDAKSLCTPSLEKWQSLKFDITYDEAKAAMQCEGILQMLYNQYEKDDQLQAVYNWKNFLSKDTQENGDLPTGAIAHQLIFVGGKLKSKNYSTNVQPFSTCSPIKLGFDKIAIGQSWTDTQNQNAMNCAATLSSVSESANDLQSQYSWGTTAGTYAYVTVGGTGKVVSKYISFTPKK